MAVPSQLEGTAAEAGDDTFLDWAHLTYIIPYGTEVDIKAEVANALAQKKPLEEIDSRPWLFFGTHCSCPVPQVTYSPWSSCVSQYSFIDAR